MTLWRIRTTIDDRPGFLAVLTASLALRSINILAVQVHATPGGAVDEFLVDAPANLSADDLIATVTKGRGRNVWVTQTDVHVLVDAPVQALGQASQLIREPDLLPDALVALLGEGTGVAWQPTAPADEPAEQIALSNPGGGVLIVTRPAPPFTPAEAARAHALVEVAAAAMRASVVRWLIILADGTEVSVRAAMPDADDVAAIQRLHESCSAATLYRRYLAGGTAPTTVAQVRRMLSPQQGLALLAEVTVADHHAAVALAHVFVEGNEAELAVLVRDDWQQRGLGTALLRRLVAIAPEWGVDVAHLHTHADNDALPRTVQRLGRPMRFHYDGPLLTLTIGINDDGAARVPTGLMAGSDNPYPAR